MTAIRQDITIEQGADFDRPFFLTDAAGNPVDITGASAAMQIRVAPGDPTALLTLSTAAGTLLVDGPAGSIAPVIPGRVTDALAAGTYAYDVKMLSAAGVTSRTHQGRASVVAEVTTVALTPAGVFGQFDFSAAGNSGLAAGAM